MRVNGVEWSVRLVAPLHPMLLTPWQTHALGVCDKVTQTIYIDKTLQPAQVKQVLCHEIVHAVMFSYGILLSYDEEEMVAEIITEFGNEIIRLTNFIYNAPSLAFSSKVSFIVFLLFRCHWRFVVRDPQKRG